MTIDYTPGGKRIVRRGSGKTKTATKEKLKEILRNHEDGVTLWTGGSLTCEPSPGTTWTYREIFPRHPACRPTCLAGPRPGVPHDARASTG